MELLELVKIGSEVKVNSNLSKDRLNTKTLEALNYSPKCIVKDFRITDGKGIRLILELSNGEREWFFENEIEILDNEGNIIERKQQMEDKNNFFINLLKNINYEKREKVKELLNPINFTKWLIFSFKNIF